MRPLTQNTILQRIPNLRLSIDSSNQLEIFWEGKVCKCGRHGLAVLDTFYQSTSLSKALDKLKNRVKGAQDWMDLVSTIDGLYETGVLQDESQRAPMLSKSPHGFDAAPIHISMLNDRTRTSKYLDGIREVVQTGDIVLDVGTGTGIWAVAAAKVGAKHVYAVEASGIGESAREIFRANGVGDKITLIEGWSAQINLPELADVMIDEIIGNEPLAENVLEMTTDAIKRLLKPDARLIPHKVRIFGLPVTIPRAELMRRTFVQENVQNWHSWYGIDFGALDGIAKNSPQTFLINPFVARGWRTLSEPVLLAEIDLNAIKNLVIDNKKDVVTSTSGQMDGLLEFFELELGPTTRFSTHPSQAEENNHWRSPVWVFLDSLKLEKGDHFEVSYGHRITEDRTKVSISRK